MSENFVGPVDVNGIQDVTQVSVSANSTQTAALQSWKAADGRELVKMTGDGRIQLGDEMQTPDALLEAHRMETSTTKPLRGFHSLGRIANLLSDTIQWVVAELHLLGNSGIQGLQTALRIRLKNDNTGLMNTASELRGLDSEVVNAGFVKTVTGLRVGTFTEAGATTETVYGIKVEMTPGTVKSYSFYAEDGIAHLGDGVEIEQLSAHPISGSQTQIYALNGKVYIQQGATRYLASFIREPQTNEQTKLLRGDGTWVTVDGANPMQGATAGQAGQSGLVPAPQAGDQIKFLRGDGTWGLIEPVNLMVGATPTTAGLAGLVPPPSTGQQTQFLRGDGTWVESGTVDMNGEAGETLLASEVVYYQNGKFFKVDIDVNSGSVKCSKVVGIVLASASSGDTVTVRLEGNVSGFTGLTPQQAVYAGAIPGQVTQLMPQAVRGGTQRVVVKLGRAISPSQIQLMPASVKYIKRALLAQNVSLSIIHPVASAMERRVQGMVTAEQPALVNYAGTNVDTDAFLMGLNDYGAVEISTLAANGTATAESFASGFPAVNAFDGNLTNAWAANLKVNTWLAFTFAQAKSIQAYTITPRSGVLNSAPRDWVLEYESSPGTWTSVDTRSAQTAWTTPRTFRINYSGVAPSATGWRIRTSADNGNNSVNIGEFDFFESIVATRLAQGFRVATAVPNASLDVRLWLRKIGVPNGILTCSLVADNGGVPSTTVIASAQRQEADLGTAYSMVNFKLEASALYNLAINTTYWIVLTTSRTTSSATDFISWGVDASAPALANGNMARFINNAWVSETARDASLEIGNVIRQGPCAIGYVGGITDDVDVNYGDTVNTLSPVTTTFRNLAAAVVDYQFTVEIE
jgi:hypothetical protein